MDYQIKMQQIPIKPLKHILVCVNERTEKSCCSKVKGYEIFRELKDWTKSNGLAGAVWVTRTGCLGFCNDIGTTIVIYPDQLWFKEVKAEEIQEIKDHVLQSLSQ
jgi:(2Fe-2S) ferredoxin